MRRGRWLPALGGLALAGLALLLSAPIGPPGPRPPSGEVAGLDASWQRVAVEGEPFVLERPRAVRYGADDGFRRRTLQGNAVCDSTTFGGDPAPGVVKGCYARRDDAPPAFGSIEAVEGEDFELARPTRIRYGADTRWIERTVQGAARCDSAFFHEDPAPQARKSCVVGAPLAAPSAPGSQARPG